MSKRATRSRTARFVLPLGWTAACAVGLLLGASLLVPGVPPVMAGLAGLALLTMGAQLGLWHRARAASRRRGDLPAERLIDKPLDYLVSLLNVSRAVTTKASLSEVSQVIVEACLDCFDCEEASLMTLERDSGDLVMAAFAGHRDVHLVRNARVRVGESVAGTVARSRTPLILGREFDERRFPGFQAKRRVIHSAMIAPVVVRDRVVGVLSVSTGNPEVVFGEDELRVLCILAEHAGIVALKARDVERVARLVRRIRRRRRDRRIDPGSAPRRAA